MKRLALPVAMLAIVAASAPLWGQQSQAPSPATAPNPVVLKVDGDEVRAAEISIVMLNLRAQLNATGGSANPDQVLEIATQRVIEQKLMAQEARRFGIRPDEETVRQLLAASEQQAGGADALERTLAAAGSSRDELVAMLEDMDLARQLIGSRIAPTVEVTDDEIRKYYADNADQFTTGERIRPRHIVFAVPEGGGSAAEERARQKAEAARQRVLAGESFADVARELSEGPSAAQGGDLGLVPPEALEPPFAAAALPLQPGQISEVVRTKFGYHVITVEERRPPGVQPLSEVRGTIERQLRQRRVAETVADLLQTLADRAEIEFLDPDLDPAAQSADPDAG